NQGIPHEHALATPIMLIKHELTGSADCPTDACHTLGPNYCLGTQCIRHDAKLVTVVLQLDIFLCSKGFCFDFGAEELTNPLSVFDRSCVTGDEILFLS